MNICIVEYGENIHMSFKDCSCLTKEHVSELRQKLFFNVVSAHCNVFISFKNIRCVDVDVIDVLIDCSRLAKMNNGQITVYHVVQNIYSAIREKNAEHLFFFSNISKDFLNKKLLA